MGKNYSKPYNRLSSKVNMPLDVVFHVLYECNNRFYRKFRFEHFF